MKLQDIIFILIFAMAAKKRKNNLTAVIGIICLIIAMLLFYFQIFFTAERLTWYGAGFILLSIVKQVSMRDDVN